MTKILIGLYYFFERRRLFFYSLTAVLFGAMIALAMRIHIEEDISRALPNGKQVEQINKIFKHSRFADKLVVRINLTDNTATPEDLTAYAATLDSALRAKYGAYISDIRGKVEDDAALTLYTDVHDHLPLYLTDEDYRHIDSMLTGEQVKKKLEQDYKVLTSATGLVMKRLIADDPIGINTMALRKLNNLQLNSDFDLYDGYILTKDHKSALLFIAPSNPANETAKNSVLVNGIDSVMQRYEADHKTVKAYCYGGTAVAVGNAKQMKKDTIVTLTITLVGLLLFLWFFFRRKRVPFIMMLPVAFGALFAIVIISLTRGRISNIALAAGSIVLGIAINYSLHFFGHYKHSGSIEETISDLVLPMTLGSFTTVGSFFSLMFVKSPILNDFGLFAGLSLTGAAFFTLVFLPHFLPKEKAEAEHERNWLDRLITSEFKHQHILVAVIVVLTIFFATQVHKVSFMSDMTALSYQTEALKAAEQQINALQGDSIKTVYLASTGKTIDEALQNSSHLSATLRTEQQKGLIKKYSALSDIVLSEEQQRERIARWEQFWTADKKAALLASLRKEGEVYKFRPQAFDRFAETLNKKYEPAGIEGYRALLDMIGSELVIDGPDTKAVISSINVKRSDRAALYTDLEHDPNTVILDKETVTHRFIDIIYGDFNDILMYTSLLVFFALLLSYGRIELTIITFLPMLITWIWILGIMGLFGIQFNIINIIISTFIFGLGDDFAIFITDGLTEKYRTGRDTLSSHKVSIFLGAVTTIIGLGALIFAQHPALRSIAVVSIIGILCVLLIGQVLQPFIYNYYIQHRKEKGLVPYTMFYFIITFIEYTYFFVASILMTLIGFILVKLLPFPGIKTRKYWFHWLICQYMKSLTYIPMHVKKVHINKELMDFSKPAIIIANHTSFLDILVTVMQNPKIILLTNEWTYHSPIFGRVIQLADYYPTADGTDEVALQKLRDKVADGYSIVVFPEGTRSIDGTIKRFHKGAFFLAEALNLDVVPLLLHGVGDTVRKGDFMVNKNSIHIKYMPRIAKDDTSFGVGYAERTKKISRYFKEEYEKLRAEIETPLYFSKKLRMNYVYKGPVLEWYIRFKLNLENHYSLYNDLIAKDANILDIGCGYGQASYMLHFLGRERLVTGIDLDETKIEIANNCFSRDERINFVAQSVLTYEFGAHDAYTITDVLHYLHYNEQELLIKRCIDRLNAGGIILIKEADTDRVHQQKLTWLSEFFSTNFGFNQMTHQELFFTSAEKIKSIAEKYGMEFSIAQGAEYSSNTIFAIRHRTP